MEAIVIGLLVILLGAYLLPEQQPPVQPPMVIYLGQAPTQNGDGWGCFPTLILLILVAVALLSLDA